MSACQKDLVSLTLSLRNAALQEICGALPDRVKQRRSHLICTPPPAITEHPLPPSNDSHRRPLSPGGRYTVVEVENGRCVPLAYLCIRQGCYFIASATDTPQLHLSPISGSQVLDPPPNCWAIRGSTTKFRASLAGIVSQSCSTSRGAFHLTELIHLFLPISWKPLDDPYR
jgi:hypothetical protein